MKEQKYRVKAKGYHEQTLTKSEIKNMIKKHLYNTNMISKDRKIEIEFNDRMDAIIIVDGKYNWQEKK